MALDPLTARIAKNPLKFFRSTSVNPPAELASFRARSPINLDPRFFSDHLALTSQQWRFTSAQVDPQVAWIQFSHDRVMPEAVTFDVEYASPRQDLNDYTAVAPDFESRVDAATRLPVWYLPWKPDHVARLSIPAYRDENVREFGGGVEIDPYNPHLFFTAGLSGCSVFAYGDPRTPTVAHAGSNTTTPYGDQSARFWRELLLAERFQRLQHEGIAHEANWEMYMETSPNAKLFQKWLKRQPSKFVVENTISFGSVFGMRYGRLWSFYLQENVVIMRHRFVKKQRMRTTTKGGFMGFFEETVKEAEVYEEKRDATISRPISVRPFFPHGGQAKFWRTVRTSYV